MILATSSHCSLGFGRLSSSNIYLLPFTFAMVYIARCQVAVGLSQLTVSSNVEQSPNLASHAHRDLLAHIPETGVNIGGIMSRASCTILLHVFRYWLL
ncbi:hypothetical protein FOXYSP1_06237 [Fusarium oxysporum f. sp. phaseoli]